MGRSSFQFDLGLRAALAKADSSWKRVRRRAGRGYRTLISSQMKKLAMRNFSGLLSCAILASISISVPCIADELKLPPQNCIKEAPGFLVDLDYPWINRDVNPVDLGKLPWTVQYLGSLHEALAQRDVVLVPLFMPAAMIFKPRRLSSDGGKSERAVEANYSEFVRAVAAAGIPTVDLPKAYRKFGNAFDFHRLVDHHWTAQGAAMSAYEVSKLIGEGNGASDKNFLRELSSWPYKLDRYRPTEFKSVVSDKCNPDNYYLTFRDYNFAKPEGSVSANALFDDEKSAIAVLGTSYAFQSNFVFSRALEYFTGRPTIAYAIRGGGPATALHEHIMSIAGKEEDVDVVVWEVDRADGNQITGAISHTLGLLHGECQDNDYLFRRFKISGRFGESIPIPSFIGVLNAFSLKAPDDVEVNLSLQYLKNDDLDLKAWLRVEQPKAKDDFQWDFYFPTLTDRADAPLVLGGLTLSLSNDDDGSGSDTFEYEAAACLKF